MSSRNSSLFIVVVFDAGSAAKSLRSGLSVLLFLILFLVHITASYSLRSLSSRKYHLLSHVAIPDSIIVITES